MVYNYGLIDEGVGIFLKNEFGVGGGFVALESEFKPLQRWYVRPLKRSRQSLFSLSGLPLQWPLEW